MQQLPIPIPSAHALLSASGASKWMACPPSARLEATFPDLGNAASEEGTLAHAMAECMLKYKIGLIKKTEYNREMKEFKKAKHWAEDMVGYMENYTDYVMEQFNLAKAHTKDAAIFLETKLFFDDYVPEGFGTGDVNIVADRILRFIDLKYGKGVFVSATENKQMMLYALGAIKAFSHLYDFDTIEMTIYQPRIDNISTWSITVEDLLKWAEEELKPKAQLAWEGKGEFAPGPACTFCKAKPVCRANAEYQLEVQKYDFAPAETLEPHEIADILNRGKELAKWVTAVQNYALLTAIHDGKQWPGFKVVEGRSNRKYTDETAVVEKLTAAGYPEDDLYSKKILGITAMQGYLKKANFDKHLGNLIIKPQGSPALVPEADPRPVFVADKADISDLFDDFENE